MTDANTARDIHQLKARADIEAALHRACRGIDRCDRAMALSAYHDDAWDDHGSFAGPAAEFVDWAITLGQTYYLCTTHSISNIHMEIRDDIAMVESYILATMRYEEKGALYDLVGAGRYLDRFEHRDRNWKIANRLVVADWDRIDEVKRQMDGDLVAKLTRGTRDSTDPSYRYFGIAEMADG